MHDLQLLDDDALALFTANNLDYTTSRCPWSSHYLCSIVAGTKTDLLSMGSGRRGVRHDCRAAFW